MHGRLVQWVVLMGLICFGAMTSALAGKGLKYDYRLSERLEKINDSTYWLQGDTEHFNLKNGGNVVNTGFIVTDAGVVVIDTGPSRLYGEQMRALIASVTDQPIVKVILTHDHPDHSFGNQAFDDLPIYAASGTQQSLHQHGLGYSDAMYRLIGKAMFGTEVVVPKQTLETSSETIGGHELEYWVLHGHTQADVAVFDKTTGVLFAGDLVFNRRAPTTPHANLDEWLASLKKLEELPIKTLVAGHGPLSRDKAPIQKTAEYLTWLGQHLEKAAAQGVSMAEALFLAMPKAFSVWGSSRDEYQRSVAHLYPKLERDTFVLSSDLERN